MNAIVTLSPGANQPLDGQKVTIELSAANLGGAALVAQDGGGVRVLARAETSATVSVTGQQARVEVTLAAVPESIVRLRLMAWSEGRTRLLVPAEARVGVDGAHRFSVQVAGGGAHLRAAEILELYRRHGSWKVRAVASGWEDHVPAMARAVGVAEAAFRDESRPAGGPARPAPQARPAHQGPSPQVGPPPLRDLLDSVVGPGPRTGDHMFLDFELDGVSLRLGLKDLDGFIQVVAMAPLGSGQLTDATAQAALRVTGTAPLARVTVDESGSAVAAALVYAEPHNLDSALVKALLSEVWIAAYRFAQLVRPLGWPAIAPVTQEVPREFRLGIAEELQDTEVWRDVRERLLLNDCLPLVDEPSAMLALTDDGQLSIGPSLLAGTNRAWAIIVERVLRSDVTPRNGLWRALAQRNAPLSPVRFGVIDEVGLHAPPAITANYAALQLPRTQVMEDLQHGLNFVDEAAGVVDGLLRSMAPDAASRRNNLSWIPERRWTGPGTEVRDQLLVRELTSVPAGAGTPAGYLDRVRSQRASLGRPGVGYLAHLALLRAESGGPAAPAWLHLAREFVHMTPVNGPGEPCAAGSIHVRLERLNNPVPRRRAAPAPPPTPVQRPSQRPSPAPAEPEPAPAASSESGPRKRWRLFG